MALKRSKYARVEDLPADASAAVRDSANRKLCETAGRVLLELVAGALDGIARDDVSHLSFGRPRAGGSFLATVHFTDQTYIRAGGCDLFNLVDQIAKDILENT